jgi:hypothetical protein
MAQTNSFGHGRAWRRAVAFCFGADGGAAGASPASDGGVGRELFAAAFAEKLARVLRFGADNVAVETELRGAGAYVAQIAVGASE